MTGKNKLKGNDGEKIAETYLVNKGYRILGKNFTTESGELDIIATDESTLIFVEVKTRYDERYGYAAEAVDLRKQKKISLLASQYIKKFGLYDVPVRFDVVEVYIKEKRINHIESAFDSYLNY